MPQGLQAHTGSKAVLLRHRCRALSDYAKVKRGERAVDLCTGNGVIPILLEAKNSGEHYSGLELQLSVQTWREEV